MNKIFYIFPKTNNFQEERPRICWKHMYGWIDGYGMMFDPVILNMTGIIPEWHNGLPEKISENDFIICPCSQASEFFPGNDLPAGIFVRPKLDNNVARISEKERFENPVRNMFYPDDMEFDTYENGLPEWKIAERPVVMKSGNGVAVGFDLFALSNRLINELVESRLSLIAEITSNFLNFILPGNKTKVDNTDILEIFRIDFQAYGLNRLMVQWLSDIEEKDRSAVRNADSFLLEALDAVNQKNADKAAAKLKIAFETLASIRQSIAPVELQLVEIPHIGILLDKKGFFEFEWPEYSRNLLDSYLDYSETSGYRIGIEAGGSCWEKLLARYPKFARKINSAVESGNIEMTNGTYSLPYALLSPLALQYLQFAKGLDTFNKCFGTTPETYQCQENSLSPQMPDLLKHFGFKQAMHITQNHGFAPPENEPFICWTSPSGCKIASATMPDRALEKLGPNFYLFLPIYASKLKNSKIHLYANFMDLGYIPFRVHMIRAHYYANVWGRYMAPSKIFPDISLELPEKFYNAEDYSLAENVFYWNETNINSLSHYEKLFDMFAKYRQLKLMNINNNIDFDDIEKTICFYESHDCAIVGGQRRGEFYSKKSNADVPPYSRDTLGEALIEVRTGIFDELKDIFNACQKEKSEVLFNASESPLAFAKIRHPEMFFANGLVEINSVFYATGDFPALGHAMPDKCELQSTGFPVQSGSWKVAADNSWITLEHINKSCRFRVMDKQLGSFNVYSVQAEKAGNLNIIKLKLDHDSGQLQTVNMTLLFSAVSDYAEVNLQYCPRNNFETFDKWQDYLSIEFDCGGIEELVQFNPNVYSVAHKNKISSPYCLIVKNAYGKIGLLNEGATLYEVDRNKKLIRWLFHVDCESVRKRRMAINFGNTDSFLLSRAWSTGLVPFDNCAEKYFSGELPEGISIENVIDSGTYLISNLKNTENTFAIKNGYTVESFAGKIASKNGIATLKPFEIGLIKRK